MGEAEWTGTGAGAGLDGVVCRSSRVLVTDTTRTLSRVGRVGGSLGMRSCGSTLGGDVFRGPPRSQGDDGR